MFYHTIWNFVHLAETFYQYRIFTKNFAPQYFTKNLCFYFIMNHYLATKLELVL